MMRMDKISDNDTLCMMTEMRNLHHSLALHHGRSCHSSASARIKGDSHFLTSCGLYFYLNHVVLAVVHKRNSSMLLLDAIDNHARPAIPGSDL